MRAVYAAVATLVLVPTAIAIFAIIGPFVTDPVLLFGGMTYSYRPGLFGGTGTIDPNMGFTAFALGLRSAFDIVSGALPLWNHYEGLGTPLLGEMQAASLFPLTLFLLLPHGQIVEHSTLQAVAGIGTYLFLRRFGLGVTAAFAGGLLFELNGVFAWLGNAIFNPVAFLPWLLYVVESLAVAAKSRRPWTDRLPFVALGVFVGALSLYAGFPEVTYLYGLIVMLWAALHCLKLRWRSLSYLADLAAVTVLSLVVAAPLLLAFISFLGQGELGGHQLDQFAGAVLPPPALLVYLLPYIYGPISASSYPVVASIWGGIGGYLGVMPLLLGLGGLICAWRQPTSWLLTAWIILTIGASHGAPFLHAAFITLPLVKIAAYYRYVNTGWIFCAITLAALLIEHVQNLAWPRRLAISAAAGTVTLSLLAAAVVAAWPVLVEFARPHSEQRLAVVLSGAIGLALLTAALGALVLPNGRWARTILVGLAAAEALTAFLIPFASNPRAGSLDKALIMFLQQNTGLQRVAVGTGSGIAPNFGAAFGIKLLNYDDLPVPQRTVTYILANIDPAADRILFWPSTTPRGPDAERAWRTDLIARFPAYAAVGVRYILADANLFARPAYDLVDEVPSPSELSQGEMRTMDLRRTGGLMDVQAIAIRLGTYGGHADGILHALLCRAADCVHSSVDLAQAADNSAQLMHFDRPLTLNEGDLYRLTLWTEGAHRSVALWTRHAPPPGKALLPELDFIAAGSPTPVLVSPTTAIFEVPEARPYAQAGDCNLDLVSNDRFVAQCKRPSRLTRLEVAMDGWTARVNGITAAITLDHDTFQVIDLPAGHSTIEFVYAPPGVHPTVWLALATLFSLLTLFFLTSSSRSDNEEDRRDS